MKWVVASQDSQGKVSYLGFQGYQVLGDGSPVDILIGEIDAWWFVEPRNASGKPTHQDYVRFDREEDAVAWYMKVMDWMESRNVVSENTYWVRRIE